MVVNMKKIIICCLLIFMLIYNYTQKANACWSQPVAFEIFSESGNKVFVFNPDEHTIENAYAAVYEIINNERHVVYTVENLTSFAYEGNFYFSTDMTHFIRTFPESGMSAFEVFSNGTKTREVKRSDFIKNYSGIESETSIGPMYTVTWEIEEHTTYDEIITIRTSEGNTMFFDFATAEFNSENIATNLLTILIVVISCLIAVTCGVGIFFLQKRRKAH